MAYNKSKYVDAAQKLLNQGKVAQAIAEYQHILRYEPRDQVTLMTVGELYIRQGETFQAIEYFERLAQLFVSDGFLTKAIAVYKRIAKLAPEEIRPLEKLADLYVQQGVMSEARPLFLQLAELHLKSNRQSEAVGLLKKLLVAEPDNLRIQIRLAELYQAMGQSGEALEAYVSAAQRALARGDQAECQKLADRALQLKPKNPDALIVKARASLSAGNTAAAADILSQVTDLEKGGESAELLLELYLKSEKWDEATAFALRIFSSDEKNFGAAQKVTQSLLESSQGERAMSVLSRIRVPMIEAGEHENAVVLLNELAASLPERLEPLEWLVETYGRTNDSFRLPDALAHLGDALVGQGKLERAKEIFEQLVDREPESDPAKRKLNGVLRKMGLLAGEPEPVAEPEPFKETLQAELPEAPAPKLRQEVDEEAPEVSAHSTAGPPAPPELDDETQKFISQSLTDVDLFASYGLTQKAIGLLEAILRREPLHTPTLEKLLDFVLGAGDDRRTAELAGQLERIHSTNGDERSSERFGELRRRFQRAAGLTDDEINAAVAAAMPQAVETTPVEEAAPEGGQAVSADVSVPAEAASEESAKAVEPEAVASAPEASAAAEEVDLSAEWASLLEETKEPPPAAPQIPAAEHDPTEFQVPVDAAAPASADSLPAEVSGALQPEEPVAPHTAETQPHHEEHLLPDEEVTALPLPEHAELASEKPEPALEQPQAALPHGPAQELEFELDQEFDLVLEPEPIAPAHEMMKEIPPTPANGTASTADQFLADLAKEMDELGLDALTPTLAEAPGAAPTPVEPHAGETGAGESGPLKEVFDEFRAELGEMGSEDEDLETHYNLGIAFREMGLLEEAIGEFQKVAKANERGKPFRYAMQCCTLLGLSFTEKGQPSIAAIWYERALQTPGIDGESKLALRYDLGVAQESAGELDAALKSFSQVYAVNIDYRDVAERIASLQKPAR
ncbi:MAG TPA: tetratricopeptide repeat protein [Candidatus Acidoferrum sp.]